MLQILFASTNKHKLEEFRNMLGEQLAQKIAFVTPEHFKNYPVIEETGTTFEENACIKAVQSSAFFDSVSIADDSGLVVDALNGAPGVFSARYAGENATDSDRIAKLLNELKGVSNRQAKFVCVIALAYRGNIVKTFRGEVNGVIAQKPSGTCGFGYDPVFIPDGYTKSFADLGADIKDKISHRATASSLACKFIKQELDSMDDFEFI